MSNKNLFQEAIADAKAVREVALANAKAALEEALTPRLQSMIAARLEENYEDTEDLEEVDLFKNQDSVSDNGRRQYIKSSAMSEKKLNATDTFFTDEEPFEDVPGTEKGSPYMEEDLDEELDLEEILAELEEENQLAEAKEDESEDEESEEDESEDEESEELDPKDPEFSEKLEKLITKIVSQELEKEEEMSTEETDEEENSDMEDIDLETDETETMEEEFDLNELLAELDEMYSEEKEEEFMQYERKMSKHEKGETKKQEKEEHVSKKEKKEKSEEMKEALSVINTLRSELNEVNLLNAKLLYVNKIFKAKSLTESQKIQVIASFDKATTIKEAKVVFESLTSTLTATKKPIKESLGFASRAAGIAPRQQQIVESNDAITRMQKLANIIK